MATSIENGWVLIARKGPIHIVEWTWAYQRKETMRKMCELFPGYSRGQILRRWKPVKARRKITIATEDI